MNKFKFLVGYGLKKRIARKAFIISNIVILILMVLVINLPSIIGVFSSDVDEEIHVNIDIYNKTGQTDLTEKFSELLNKEFDGYEYYVLVEPEEEFDEDYFWQESKQDVTIIIEGTIEEPKFSIYTNDIEIYSALHRNAELLIINFQIADYTEPEIGLIVAPDYENPEEEMMLSSLMSLLILPMFMLVILATQFIGVDIIEEKSTKAIETIISSVPANTHFFSKIISSVLFVIIQGALVLVYGTLGVLVSKLFGSSDAIAGGSTVNLLEFVAELIPNWPVVIVITLLFMVVGTLLFLVIAALFASMAVTQEDYQQFQTPLMLILLGSFYVALFGSMSGGGTFIKVMSYIPLVSPMLVPVAFASGMISIAEALISLLILIVTLVTLTYLFTPVYRVAILSYDQTKFFTRIRSYFKKGFQKNNKNK